MTAIAKDILDNYQIRKTKKQKAAFRAYATEVCARLGYTATVEKGAFGVRNLVVGDVDKAKVVYTAHYDTCPVLPFPNFITPKRVDLYILYQLALVVAMLIPAVLLGFGMGMGIGFISTWIDNPVVAELVVELAPRVVFIALMALLLFGPANKHTANDNTSGVTVLFAIMAALPADKRDEVAFVFFDLEEAGMFGSSAFASKHKAAMKTKPLVNFDCVSDGETMIFALRKKAVYLKGAFEAAFPATATVDTAVYTKGIFYPSDQANFPQGVGVAALKKTKKRGILYMDRIHTKRDTVYREENIAYLADGAVKLVELL